MSKKVVISGYYGADNFGDEAILETLVKRLKNFGTDITVLSSNPEKTKKNYNVNAVKKFDLRKVINAISKSDVLISGGGSLLQDATSLKSLLYYLFVIFIAQFLKKDVIIFAQGIGPISSKIGEFFTKNLLKKCRWVSVRDEKSLFLLRGWGIKTELVCDPLYDLELTGSRTEKRVGVQLRSFKTLSEKLLITLANRIAIDFSDKEIEIYSFQDSEDLEVCKHFESLLLSVNPNLKTNVISGKTPKQIISLIADLEYMIAMRFHAILIALRYGIKTLAINYDYKVENIANEAKIPALSMNVTENYGYMFNRLKNLDHRALLDWVNKKKFDWEVFDLLVK